MAEKPPAAHDVLAAEEFGVPAPDPRLHHGPVKLPDDPTGIPEPHDILAAEEFALPAPVARYDSSERPGPGAGSTSRPAVLLAGAVALLVLRRARRRRR
jgi:hypothetical protein